MIPDAGSDEVRIALWPLHDASEFSLDEAAGIVTRAIEPAIRVSILRSGLRGRDVSSTYRQRASMYPHVARVASSGGLVRQRVWRLPKRHVIKHVIEAVQAMQP